MQESTVQGLKDTVNDMTTLMMEQNPPVVLQEIEVCGRSLYSPVNNLAEAILLLADKNNLSVRDIAILRLKGVNVEVIEKVKKKKKSRKVIETLA